MTIYSKLGRVKVSTTLPPLSGVEIPLETEINYRGLIRDLALSDLESGAEAQSEVLADIQDPAEQRTQGKFTSADLEIIDGIINYGLKNEDLSILKNTSLNLENESGDLSPLVNPRQRIADRIKQLEFFAGRGTVYQGQGASLFKYYVPEDETDNSNKLYSHTNPPPFYTHDLNTDENASGAIVEHAPDFIPVGISQIESSHRIGYVKDGSFVPDIEKEWWWTGSYRRDYRSRNEYTGSDAFSNPRFPVVRDGNFGFSYQLPKAIPSSVNWGIRADFWMKKSSDDGFGKFRVKVSGHLRIDYFEFSGYDASGNIQGTWKTAIDTTDLKTYYTQPSIEQESDDVLGYVTNYVQGGPSQEEILEETSSSVSKTPRTAANGASWDYENTLYDDREGVSKKAFNQYVPVVIRYWYGQQDSSEFDTLIADKGLENITAQDRAKIGPGLDPGFTLDHLIAEGEDPKWNDYKSIVKINTSDNGSNWTPVDNTIDLTTNFNGTVEVLAYSTDSSPGLDIYSDKWTNPREVLIGNVNQTTGVFTCSALGLSSGPIYVAISNRVVSAAPVDYSEDELWQRYVFHPNLNGEYLKREDMLEGRPRYSEPDPAKIEFELNYEAYKIIFGELPQVNFYDTNRYDGALINTITESSSARDYDYSHNKLLFIGRQKKDSAVKALQSGETRTDGDNYTFFTITENEAGLGGSIKLLGVPANNYGIISSSATSGTVGKALHMADNVSKFADDTIQLYSTSASYVSANSNAAQGFNVQFTYIDGTTSKKRHLVPVNPGTNKDIADSDFGSGAGEPDQDTNEMYLPGVIKNDGTIYYFYDLIGVARETEEGSVTVSIDDNGDTTITNNAFFGGLEGKNGEYLGTRIDINGTSHYVIAYDFALKKVTIEPALQQGDYNCEIYYNFLSFSGLPSDVINTSQQEVNTNFPFGNTVDLIYVYNSGYQFRKIDSGAGLGISDSLYLSAAGTPTQGNPFAVGSEIPAPPAQIVTPYGYDNSVTSSDPGLGGICYPPYRTQDIQLLNTAKTTSDLEDDPEGQFDVYWGSTATDEIDNLGGKYLQVNKKLTFDFDLGQIDDILVKLENNEKPDFITNDSAYNSKLLIEIPAKIPTDNANNPYLYRDALLYTNRDPAKSQVFLFLNKTSNQINMLSKNDPTV